LGVVPVAYYPNAEINKQKIIKENSPGVFNIFFYIIKKASRLGLLR
jgi:hypothetical protein